MLKITAPIINLTAEIIFLPIFVVIVIALKKLLGNNFNDEEIIFTLIILAGLFFLTTNVIMKKLDKLKQPGITDHFRQCSLIYITAIIVCSLVYIYGSSGTILMVFANFLGATSIIIVAINAIYLIATKLKN